MLAMSREVTLQARRVSSHRDRRTARPELQPLPSPRTPWSACSSGRAKPSKVRSGAVGQATLVTRSRFFRFHRHRQPSVPAPAPAPHLPPRIRPRLKPRSAAVRRQPPLRPLSVSPSPPARPARASNASSTPAAGAPARRQRPTRASRWIAPPVLGAGDRRGEKRGRHAGDAELDGGIPDSAR